MFNAQQGNGKANVTAAAGTAFLYLVQPLAGLHARVTQMRYKDTGTSHTLTFMRPIGRTTVGAAAAGTNTIQFAAQPGLGANNLAANDYVAIRESDGVTRFYKVSAVPGAYPGNVTLTTNLVAGTLGGEKAWNFGIPGDTGEDGDAHFALPSDSASGVYTEQDSDGGIVATFKADDPILFHSDNATNQGKLKLLTWSYTGN